MIHLIFSEQDVMAKEAASKLIKKDFPEKTEFNFVSFDMLVTPLSEAARECEMLSTRVTSPRNLSGTPNPEVRLMPTSELAEPGGYAS